PTGGSPCPAVRGRRPRSRSRGEPRGDARPRGPPALRDGRPRPATPRRPEPSPQGQNASERRSSPEDSCGRREVQTVRARAFLSHCDGAVGSATGYPALAEPTPPRSETASSGMAFERPIREIEAQLAELEEISQRTNLDL